VEKQWVREKELDIVERGLVGAQEGELLHFREVCLRGCTKELQKRDAS